MPHVDQNPTRTLTVTVTGTHPAQVFCGAPFEVLTAEGWRAQVAAELLPADMAFVRTGQQLRAVVDATTREVIALVH